MLEALLSGRITPLVDEPGPLALKAGTTTTGYYGVVASTDFIDGATLKSLVGLTVGTAANSASDWLKFAIDGKKLFVPKLPLAYALSWNNLSTAALVDGSTVVTIKGRQYKVRLIRGADANPATAAHDTSNPSGTTNSEWQRTLENVCSSATGTAGWETFTAAALGLTGTTGNGVSTLCQEPSTTNQSNVVAGGYIVLRGYRNVMNYYVTLANNGTAQSGWRPVLELIG